MPVRLALACGRPKIIAVDDERSLYGGNIQTLSPRYLAVDFLKPVSELSRFSPSGLYE